MRILYVPLESYEERYSYQLKDWNEREFKRLEIDYAIIDPYNKAYLEERFNDKINCGQVLDAHRRTSWALGQIQTLVGMAYRREIMPYDFIFFEDMFHPGIEALFYVFSQQYGTLLTPWRPKIGVRCLAQTPDPDDFVHYTNMTKWMRPYENMVNAFVDIVFVASEEMIPFLTAAGWTVPVCVTGLPFGKEEVVERLQEPIKDFDSRKMRVVFTSRLAKEKQPEFFLSLAKYWKENESQEVEFAICSGGRISYPAVDKYALQGVVKIYPNLSKRDYYKILNDSRVLFNCALQDWVSNTLSEADALGCNVVFPAYRSFPEALMNSEENLYIPWSLSNAITKVQANLAQTGSMLGAFSDHQDGSIARTVMYMKHIIENPISHDTLSINPQDTRYRQDVVGRSLKGFFLK